jgi:HEAT repeat protein
MGDPAALPTLRHGVESPYRSIQAHCARSLGTLGDQASAPLLLARLRSETDKGLQIAFASALGNLQSKAALETVLHTLESTENEGARMELALAVARIGGDEAHFIRLMRGMHHDSGTTAAQVLSAWKRRREKMLSLELKVQTDACSAHFAADRAAEGKATLFELARVLAAEHELVPARILQECARQLEQHPERHEYLVLALHMLQVDEK